MSSHHKLEPATRRFVEAAHAAAAPSVDQIPVAEARQNMRNRQGHTATPATILHTHHSAPSCEFELLRPAASTAETLPLILHFHGGGWALGDFETHARLLFDMVHATGAALAFPLYARSPEAQFPTAVDQCFALLQWLTENAPNLGFDPARIAVSGDSAGGALAAAMAILAAQHAGRPGVPRLVFQALLYPVLDDNFDTASYREFATGFNLERTVMQWYWDQYAPTPELRLDPLAAPLKAPLELLANTAPALILTAECDVLRDEGEAYARRLAEAGVRTFAWRALGTVHSFLLANGLAGSPAAESAMHLLAAHLRRA